MFFQIESGLGRLARVSGGIRGDRVTTKNVGGFFGDRSTDNAAASGFGALTLGPFEGFSVTTQVSRGFRDPVLSDRYFRGPSGRGFITGNPDLEPETSLQFDLATRYTVSRTQFAVYFYQYRIDDLIERYQTQPDFFFFRNRGRARLRGFEVEARSDLGRGYSIDVGMQVARGRALDDNANLDDISPVTFSLLGRKQFGEAVYAQARLGVYAKDDRPGPSEIEAPGATVFDVGAGWKIVPAARAARASAQPAERYLLRQPRSAIRVRAWPLVQPDRGRPVLSVFHRFDAGRSHSLQRSRGNSRRCCSLRRRSSQETRSSGGTVFLPKMPLDLLNSCRDRRC